MLSVSIGVFLLIMGPASAYIVFKMFNSGNLGLASNVISNLNSQVAMGFALFVTGLMTLVKGISVLNNRASLQANKQSIIRK